MGDLSPDDVDINASVKSTEINPEKAILLIDKEYEQTADSVPQVDIQVPEVQDRFHLVYIILLLHGVGVLMPWNMFINANDYFVHFKLNYTAESGATEEKMSKYQDYFLSCLGFVAQIPNVLSAALNLFCQFSRGSLTVRIMFGIIVMIIVFVVTIVLAMVDSTSWPIEFFWITMVSVVIINVANGVYQNSIYGIAASLPVKYTNAVILGSNTSGLVTSIIALIVAAATPDPKTSAIYYFLTAVFVLLIAFDTYFALPLLSFYKHHFKKSTEKKQVLADEEEDESYMTKYKIVVKKCWAHLLSVFFVFFVTLSCFPAIEAGIERADKDFFINDRFYTLVTCFFFFNLFAVVGSLLTEFVKRPGPKYVWIPVLARVLFIPFFLLCNFRPDTRNIPVAFENDYVYCAGSILLALTSGYFSSLCMTYAPSNVEDKYKGIAGMMAAFCLIFGVFMGIVFTFPLIYMIEKTVEKDTTIALFNTSAFEFSTAPAVTL